MATYFLSYARKDSLYAEAMRKQIELLDSANQVFMDVHSIKVEDKWRQRLTTSIKMYQYFILLFSENASMSDFINKEINMVRKSETESGQRKLFVLKLDDTPIPPYLAEFQIQTCTNNLVVDFYKLMPGISAGHSFYTVMDIAENELKHDGYTTVRYL